MTSQPRTIDFYFDFSSPYSYIASEWVEALAARHGRTVSWRAILLGATFQASELKSPVSYPLKREYSFLDFERSARFAGVPLKMPEKFWWLHSNDEARASAWARHCLRAYFARGVDLSDLPALRGLCEEFGIDAALAQDICGDPAWKAALKSANDAAIALGVFGAPFFIIDGEPFWGNDRRAQIERWLEKGPF
jgi:2-hydroxychromene-2-carboxylate isomerase